MFNRDGMVGVRKFSNRAHRRRPLNRFSLGASLLVLAAALSGCLFGVAGKSSPTTQDKINAYFRQATGLQGAANKCPNASCKDAQLTAAVRVYQKILTLNPLSEIAYFDLGVIYTASGQYSSARTALGKSLLIAPDYFPALYNLAYVNSESGDTGQAISLYAQAAATKDASKVEKAEALFNLGYLYDTTHQRVKGDSAFTQAVALEPSLLSKIPAAYLPAGLEASTTTTTTLPSTSGVSGLIP